MPAARRALAVGLAGFCLLLSACAAPQQESVLDATWAEPQFARADIPRDPSDPGEWQMAQSDALSDEELFGFTSEEGDGDNDPLETVNRFTFAFNDMVDTLFLRPAAFTYRELLPRGVRNSVRSFLRNLATPVILMNDLFQGDGDRALNTSKRFLINTAFSLGFYDYAAELDHPYYEADFGQTMAIHGAGEGFYLVLPLFGPSSLRDATGTLVDNFLDPLTYVASGEEGRNLSIGRAVVGGIDTRSRNIDALDEALADSLDPYTRVRALWRQLREEQIEKRRALSEDDPDFGAGTLPQL